MIEALEANGSALVIRPTAPLGIGRVERAKHRLNTGYDEGDNDAARCADELKSFLS